MRLPATGGGFLLCWIPVLALLFPLANWLYWPQVLEAGVLPSNGDSISIPMFGSLLLAPLLAALLALWAWPAVRKANPYAGLLAWRRDSTVRSILGTAIYGGAASFFAWAAIDCLRPELPDYEHSWLVLLIPLAVWNLLLRSAFVDKLPVETDQEETIPA